MEIFTTMITPYKTDGSIDSETAQKYVDWYFENGLDGIFAICQSSEIFYLSLEERVALNKLVYERAKQLERKSGRKFTVISSGHVSDTIEEQAAELGEIFNSGTDALILITNRLAKKLIRGRLVDCLPPALPEGRSNVRKYSIIYADPPWQYQQKGVEGTAEKIYPTMALEDLCMKRATRHYTVVIKPITTP